MSTEQSTDGALPVDPVPPAADTRVQLRRKKEKLAIVGFAPTWNMAPFKDEAFEVWGCNEFYLLKDQIEGFHIDVLFELHSRNEIEKKARSKEHAEWLKTAPCWLIMQKHFEDIPKSVPFPKDFIVEKYGSYFTNTISWQIALALELGYKEIHLYGVNMANDEEYASQRPSVEYFVGLARGRGVTVFIPDESDILKSWTLYGFDDEQTSIIQKRINHLRAEHIQRKGQHEAEANQHMVMAHRALGWVEACDYMVSRFMNPNATFNEFTQKKKET